MRLNKLEKSIIIIGFFVMLIFIAGVYIYSSSKQNNSIDDSATSEDISASVIPKKTLLKLDNITSSSANLLLVVNENIKLVGIELELSGSDTLAITDFICNPELNCSVKNISENKLTLSVIKGIDEVNTFLSSDLQIGTLVYEGKGEITFEASKFYVADLDSNENGGELEKLIYLVE